MNTERKRLILDHLHNLLTLEQVAQALDVSVQRSYQIKQQLFRDYRIPQGYWRNGPACARWVAAQDARCYHVPANTPASFYHNERWGER